jgi:16S rRNA (guanine527-N7)-methyltransferase
LNNRLVPMQPNRIAELLHPFLSPISNPCHSEQGQRPSEEPAVLSSTQLYHISTYIDILQRWNARINLTAIRSEEEIVTRHFGESFFAARHLFPDAHVGTAALACPERSRRGCAAEQTAVRLADLGSGAGFPGLPIKLWALNTAVTLIESNHKKATFLREVARALTLTGVNIMEARAENITETFDIVTFRAVERFADALRAARSLLATAGRLAILVTSSQLLVAQSTLPDVSWQAPIRIPHSQSRELLVGQLSSL